MSTVNDLITKDPDILGGTPVFRGTRVPFHSLLDYLEAGQTLDDFLDDFPTVTRQTAVQALEHATQLVVSHFDEVAPRRMPARKLKAQLLGHECTTVPEAGLADKKNGRTSGVGSTEGSRYFSLSIAVLSISRI